MIVKNELLPNLEKYLSSAGDFLAYLRIFKKRLDRTQVEAAFQVALDRKVITKTQAQVIRLTQNL